VKLYWSPRSPFVRKVMVCAHELGIAGEIETIYTVVSLAACNADMMHVNPLGRIPTLITDDGTVLYDSAVICEYFDSKHGGSRLFPADGAARWEALRRHALADGMLETLVLWLGERRKKANPGSSGQLAVFERKIASALDFAEHDERARDTTRFDIGHLTLAVTLGYIDFRFADLAWRANHPELARWFETAGARASMLITAPHDELASAPR
jgi:glutathione S-transferase